MGAADGGQEEQGKQKKPEPNGVLKRDIILKTLGMKNITYN